MILGSTVRGLGEGTIFWNMKDKFHVIGPVTLGIGLILLMVTEGLISNHQVTIKRLESLLATPEVEIDINDQHTYPKQTTVNAGQRTSKVFSGQLPRLHHEDETDKLSSEKVPFIPGDLEPAVKQKSYSVKQIKQKIKTAESTVQKTKMDLTTQSNNGDELPIEATARSFESEQALNKPILQGESEKVMSLTSLPPWEYRGCDISKNVLFVDILKKSKIHHSGIRAIIIKTFLSKNQINIFLYIQNVVFFFFVYLI